MNPFRKKKTAWQRIPAPALKLAQRGGKAALAVLGAAAAATAASAAASAARDGSSS